MRFQFTISSDSDDLMGIKEMIAMELERRFGWATFDGVLDYKNFPERFTLFFEASVKPGFEKSALRDVKYYYSTCKEILLIDGSSSEGPAPPPPPKPDILPEPAPSPALASAETEQTTFLGRTRQK